MSVSLWDVVVIKRAGVQNVCESHCVKSRSLYFHPVTFYQWPYCTLGFELHVHVTVIEKSWKFQFSTKPTVKEIH